MEASTSCGADGWRTARTEHNGDLVVSALAINWKVMARRKEPRLQICCGALVGLEPDAYSHTWEAMEIALRAAGKPA